MTIALTFLITLSQPAVLDGDLADRGGTSDIASELRDLGEGWGGYAVPRVVGQSSSCGGGGVVSLEGDRGRSRSGEEDGGELALFFEVEGGRLTRLRLAGTECEVDAGGATVSWWSPVSERDSLVLLDGLARAADEDLAEDAVTAIAFHATDGAAARLDGLARADALNEEIREKAVFWLGAARDELGLEALSGLASSLDDAELREKVAFALHVSEAEGATGRLVEMAESDPVTDVRGEALFWLAQEAGEAATRAIADAVASDPDVRLKEKAVFALSQLPPDEGVPLLIDVAETHPQAEVRKKAMFWLGQSNDPRALALFERILLER